MSSAEGPVRFDPASFGAVPGARALRRWMRQARRRRAGKSFGQAAEDLYVILFTVVMVGATGGNLVRELNTQSASCATWSCWELIDQVPFVLVPLLVAMMIRVLLNIGPVSATPAAGFWLLASPVDRSALLRPSYRLVITAAAMVGAVVSFVAWMILGFRMVTVGLATVLTTVLLISVACVTVWAQQTGRRTKWALRVADLLLAVAAAAALKLTFTPEQPAQTVHTLGLSDVPAGGDGGSSLMLSAEQIQLIVAGGLGILLVSVLVLITAQTLDKLSRTSVIAGGELLAGLAGAAVALDVSLLGDVVAARHWRLVGRRTSRRGRGFGPAALIHRELRRILGWPRRLVVGFALLLAPYAASSVGYDLVVPVLGGIAGFIAVRPLLDGLRSVLRSTGLVRALGMTRRALRLTLSVVPAGVAALWTMLLYPALESPVTAFAVAAGIVAGTVRQASAPPPSYAGPLLASPMGAIPPGLFSQPLRGPDLLIVCLVPVLLALDPVWLVTVPAVVLALLFATNPKPV